MKWLVDPTSHKQTRTPLGVRKHSLIRDSKFVFKQNKWNDLCLFLLRWTLPHINKPQLHLACVNTLPNPRFHRPKQYQLISQFQNPIQTLLKSSMWRALAKISGWIGSTQVTWRLDDVTDTCKKWLYVEPLHTASLSLSLSLLTTEERSTCRGFY